MKHYYDANEKFVKYHELFARNVDETGFMVAYHDPECTKIVTKNDALEILDENVRFSAKDSELGAIVFLMPTYIMVTDEDVKMMIAAFNEDHPTIVVRFD